MKYGIVCVMLLLTSCSNLSEQLSLWGEPNFEKIPEPRICPVEQITKMTKVDPARRSRTPDEIDIVIECNKSTLKMAYLAARQRHDIQGKVVFYFTIEGSGDVSHVKLRSFDMSDQQLEADLLNRAHKFKFLPYDGEQMTLTVPIMFTPSSGL